MVLVGEDNQGEVLIFSMVGGKWRYGGTIDRFWYNSERAEGRFFFAEYPLIIRSKTKAVQHGDTFLLINASGQIYRYEPDTESWSLLSVKMTNINWSSIAAIVTDSNLFTR